MTESTVHKETVALGEAIGALRVARKDLLLVLDAYFPGQIPKDVLDRIHTQQSYPVLDEWYRTALSAKDVSTFLANVYE